MNSEPLFVQLAGTISVVERITSQLRAAILAGRMEPGQEFTLRELADRLGVSYIPVREALRSLEAEGLLVTNRGRSANVAPMSAEEVHAIFRLRRRVEPELAALAAVRHDAESLDRIEQALDTCSDPSITLEAHYELHHDTHLNLIRPAMTTWDRSLTQMLLRAGTRYARQACVPEDDDARRGCAEHVDTHRELPRAFRAGDPDRARAIMHDHLDSAEYTALRAVQPSPVAPSGAQPGRLSA